MLACVKCGVDISTHNALSHGMDSSLAYICNKNPQHYALVPVYGELIYDMLNTLAEAGDSQSLEERKHSELRFPDVTAELLPSLLRPCMCGGLFKQPLAKLCRKCVSVEVLRGIDDPVETRAKLGEDIWIPDAAKRIRKIADAWGVSL